MKRSETLAIEKALANRAEEKRRYGCEEVTIGFPHDDMGNEIVDFMDMDSKGCIRCYEIKVTKKDLASSAKKSWHGHLNYLVVSEALFSKVGKDVLVGIPSDVGLVVIKEVRIGKKVRVDFCTERKAQRRGLSWQKEAMLKESLVRTLWWKMRKFRDGADEELMRSQQSELRKVKADLNRYRDRAEIAEHWIAMFERYHRLAYGEDISLEEAVERLREQWQKNKEIKNQ